MKVHCFFCGEEYDDEKGYGDFNEFCSGECEFCFNSNRIGGSL